MTLQEERDYQEQMFQQEKAEYEYQDAMNAQAQAEHEAMMQEQEVGNQEPQQESGATIKPMFEAVKPEPQTERPLTVGETLVGISFNPSGDEKVNRAKQICAELADLIVGHQAEKGISLLYSRMIDHALFQVLNAQMNVVKVLTFKDSIPSK